MIPMIISHKIKLATRAAKYSNVKRAKVSAIAFTGSGQLLATAHNRRLNGVRHKWTQHAEEYLIQKLHKLKAFARFEDICILVLRIKKKGLAIAKPCKKCVALLEKYPVTILYTDIDGIVQEIRT